MWINGRNVGEVLESSALANLQQLQTTAARPGSVGAGGLSHLEMRIFPSRGRRSESRDHLLQELDYDHDTATMCIRWPP